MLLPRRIGRSPRSPPPARGCRSRGVARRLVGREAPERQAPSHLGHVRGGDTAAYPERIPDRAPSSGGRRDALAAGTGGRGMLDEMASHRTPRGCRSYSSPSMSAACGGTIAPGSEAAPASAGPASAIRPATVTLGPAARPSQTPGPSGTPLPSGVLASIPLKVGGVGGGAPSVATIGFGSVWVESHRGTQLFRIIPTSDRVIATIDVGQESCGEPEAGFGSVWLGPCDSSSTKMIAVGCRNEPGRRAASTRWAVQGLHQRCLWISQLGKLSKVDPESYRTVATYDVFPGASITWVVDAGGSIWVGSQTARPASGWGAGEGGSLERAGDQPPRSSPDPGPYATMTADLGYIWVKGDDSGRLMRIRPGDRRGQDLRPPGI